MSAAASGRGGTMAEAPSQISALSKAAAKTTLDLSFMEISNAEDLVEKYREEICGIMPGDKVEHPKASPVIIKLNNNDLGDITNLDAAIESIADISKVVTLDLSFNSIHEIEGAFNSFPSLGRLYLHSNCLSRFGEVLHIQADCLSMTHLTLHGNPLREKPGYRAYVLSCLPYLKSLDFSATTPSEIRGAQRWRENNKTKADKRLARTS